MFMLSKSVQGTAVWTLQTEGNAAGQQSLSPILTRLRAPTSKVLQD